MRLQSWLLLAMCGNRGPLVLGPFGPLVLAGAAIINIAEHLKRPHSQVDDPSYPLIPRRTHFFRRHPNVKGRREHKGTSSTSSTSPRPGRK
jgi:hypothetical protein